MPAVVRNEDRSRREKPSTDFTGPDRNRRSPSFGRQTAPRLPGCSVVCSSAPTYDPVSFEVAHLPNGEDAATCEKRRDDQPSMLNSSPDDVTPSSRGTRAITRADRHADTCAGHQLYVESLEAAAAAAAAATEILSAATRRPKTPD
jgi:hypothetical protein